MGFCLVDGRGHGYLLSHGAFTSIDVPGSTSNIAVDVSPEGVVIGSYSAPDGTSHGYVWRGGQFKTVDVPGGVFTFASGISPEGEIVGKYETADFTGSCLKKRKRNSETWKTLQKNELSRPREAL